MTEPPPLGIALLGCGTVGSAVVRLLHEHADDITARVGRPLQVVGIAVRRPGLRRDLPIDPALVGTDPDALVVRDDVDIVVEVIGGIEPARRLILAALGAGKQVVTANKALLAQDGPTLFAAARQAGQDLYYEASVAGAIPLLRPMRESLAGDRITRVLGIVNGTCNYILSRMEASGASFSDALDEATALGYAEADPTADIEAFDAAAKAAILAGIAFHTRVRGSDVHREGIVDVSAADVSVARDMGCVVRLLAIAERTADDRGVVVRVHPALVPREHPLASVRGAYNAVFVEAVGAGQLMFYGPGAGGVPTASAVLGDIVAVARHRLSGSLGPGESAYADLEPRPAGAAITRYYVNLEVADKPGVLAAVAQQFAAREVSIQTVRQEGHGDDARLVIVTHEATEAALSATVEVLRGLDVVRAVASVMRVEGMPRH